MRHLMILASLLCGGPRAAAAEATDTPRPNVLFIAVDDLNDWIGCLGAHPQTVTPNFDRLAASGLLFTNAHCPAPACNPSRSAIFTGRSPHRSGLYDNRQQMREVMPDAKLLPAIFRDHGYRAMGSGKMLHYFIDAASWDTYFPDAASENPFPPTYDPPSRPVSLPVGGPWQYVETDWAALDVTEEQFGGDWSVSGWVAKQLQQPQDAPFFLACGLYRPHEPWFVPQKYYVPFPLEDIQLPPGYLADDLDDVPPAGQRVARNRYFAHILKSDQWKQGLQGYLASIHFADAMLGRVLDALESGPHTDNTIVVLWSDHGWQLGEKEHWQKFTPWRAVTRVPLMMRVPADLSTSLPGGTTAGSVCPHPVSLLGLFPTLLQLCDLPEAPQADGISLLPLLQRPDRGDWSHLAATHLATPGSFALSGRTHRYIHYANGEEELYDVTTDPHEWTNLAGVGAHRAVLEKFRRRSPQSFASKVEPSVESLTQLAWQPLPAGTAPASQPDGRPFPVIFENSREHPVELFWMDRQGTPKSYGQIAAGQRKRQQTRPGAVWMIQRPGGAPLGYFRVGDRTARGLIPD